MGMTQSDLSENALDCVKVRINFVALNYRDYLAANGFLGPKAAALAPGNEGAGIILESAVRDLAEGDCVFVNSGGLGEKSNGTTAAEITVPASSVCKIPAGLTLRQAAIAGVPSLVAAEALSLFPTDADLPVAVTGASGGTGRVAATFFARAGRKVTAMSRNADCTDVLKRLGVNDFIQTPHLDELNADTFGPDRFSAAFDVTGVMLNWLTRNVAQGGVIAVTGFAGGHQNQINTISVLLKCLALIGVNAGISAAAKARALKLVARNFQAADFNLLAHEIDPADVSVVARNFPGHSGRGRILVGLA